MTLHLSGRKTFRGAQSSTLAWYRASLSASSHVQSIPGMESFPPQIQPVDQSGSDLALPGGPTGQRAAGLFWASGSLLHHLADQAQPFQPLRHTLAPAGDPLIHAWTTVKVFVARSLILTRRD